MRDRVEVGEMVTDDDRLLLMFVVVLMLVFV